MSTPKILKGTLCITKNSENKVVLRVRDASSRQEFLYLEMSKAEFADALFGLAERPVTMQVEGLHSVGKVKETKEGKVFLNSEVLHKKRLSSYSKEDLEAYLVKHHQLEGWTLNPRLGSQSSVVHEDRGITLHFSYHRYVRK